MKNQAAQDKYESKILSPEDTKNWKLRRNFVIPDNTIHFFTTWVPDQDSLLSPEVIDLLGYEPHEFSGHWFDHVHQNDRTYQTTEILKSFATHTPLKLRYRMRKKNGSYILIESYLEQVLDRNNTIIDTIGYVLDATHLPDMKEPEVYTTR